jgi:hypothetical protein
MQFKSCSLALTYDVENSLNGSGVRHKIIFGLLHDILDFLLKGYLML